MTEHVFRVHYNDQGQIIGTEYTNLPTTIGNYAYIDVGHELADIRHTTHKVDVQTKELVELSAEERAEMNRPTAQDVFYARSSELVATDRTQVPDYPISTEERSRWENYRALLRDLPKAGDPTQQLLAWPKRPDGVNPIQHLLNRLETK